MHMKFIYILLTVFLCLSSPLRCSPDELVASDSAENSEFDDNGEDNQIDPYEPFNRSVYEFNRGLDTFVFRPLAELYRGGVPSPARDSIHNAMSNLGSPLTFVNDVLQLEGDRALDTFARFLINSTLGIAGLFDVATEMGIEQHQQDFGQTLASAGIESGPYFMLPILGPSNPRDLLGRIADVFIDPFNIIMYRNDLDSVTYIRTGTDLLDHRERSIEFTDRIDKSLDPYAQYRSLYIQNREYNTKKQLDK
jgi:phospholipid-binding lipoprotein MlaA